MKKNNLQRLISSLNKKEIRVIKKELQHKNKLSLLFGIYLKHHNDHNTTLHLNKNKAFKSLSVLKTQLYQNILRILGEVNLDNIQNINLMDTLRNAYILRSKGMVDNSFKEALKGYDLSKNLAIPIYQMLFIDYLDSIANTLEKYPFHINIAENQEKELWNYIADKYIKIYRTTFNNLKLNSNLEETPPLFFGKEIKEILELAYPEIQVTFYIMEGNDKVVTERNPLEPYQKGWLITENRFLPGRLTNNRYNYNLNWSIILHAICWNQKELSLKPQH